VGNLIRESFPTLLTITDFNYLTLRSVLSLNLDPQNSEMKFCENMKLKIIIVMIGYTLNNFTTLFTIL
jgi:uncharacterized protein YqiB (DUF1249 family)